MKVGINARCLQRQRTGLANYTINLLANLLEIGGDEKYYLFSPRQVNYLSLEDFLGHSRLQDRYSEMFSWPVSLKPGSLISQFSKVIWEKFYLTHELNRQCVDLFHDPSFSLPYNFNRPKILTVHDLSFLKFPGAFTARTYFYHKFFLKDTVKRADIVIAVSESVKNDITEFYGIREDKIRVIYEGLNQIYLESDICTAEDENIAKLTGRRPFIMSVSAMNPRKNIPNIVRAFNVLKGRHRDLRLVLVGRRAWGCSEIEKTIGELDLDDRIIFTGYVSDRMLKCLYQNATVFLYPSLYEGFGLPLLEAMACGTPVITSNVSSMPEVAGQAGLLVDPLDYNAMAEAIDAVLTDTSLRSKLIKSGQRRAAMFSWRKAAEQTLAAYRSLF